MEKTADLKRAPPSSEFYLIKGGLVYRLIYYAVTSSILCSRMMLGKHLLLHIVQLLRKVYVISLRIFEAEHFVPECRNLLGAIFLYFVYARVLVNELSVIEYLPAQVNRVIVAQLLALPYGILVEYLIIFLIVADNFAVYRYNVSQCLVIVTVCVYSLPASTPMCDGSCCQFV